MAERIAAWLRERTGAAEALAVDQVADVGAYEAVVLGSPVYNGAWLPPAQRWVRDNLASLESRRLWLFSVGALGDTHRVVGP